MDFQIDGQFRPLFVKSNSLLLLHGSAGTENVLHWEWVLMFHNKTVMVLADNQTVSYSFADVADRCISLNASNDISWQTVSYTVTVQKAIQGLLLTASSDVVLYVKTIQLLPHHLSPKEVKFPFLWSLLMLLLMRLLKLLCGHLAELYHLFSFSRKPPCKSNSNKSCHLPKCISDCQSCGEN